MRDLLCHSRFYFYRGWSKSMARLSKCRDTQHITHRPHFSTQGRVNVRLRVQLMDSLLAQDGEWQLSYLGFLFRLSCRLLKSSFFLSHTVGFFDVTKTGDITSRLSSDTTLVGDQITLNVNVFLRSVVQAVGVLIFMFILSWQLSIIAFISVPVVTALSKWVRIRRYWTWHATFLDKILRSIRKYFLSFACDINLVWEFPSQSHKVNAKEGKRCLRNPC